MILDLSVSLNYRKEQSWVDLVSCWELYPQLAQWRSSRACPTQRCEIIRNCNTSRHLDSRMSNSQFDIFDMDSENTVAILKMTTWQWQWQHLIEVGSNVGFLNDFLDICWLLSALLVWFRDFLTPCPRSMFACRWHVQTTEATGPVHPTLCCMSNSLCCNLIRCQFSQLCPFLTRW